MVNKALIPILFLRINQRTSVMTAQQVIKGGCKVLRVSTQKTSCKSVSWYNKKLFILKAAILVKRSPPLQRAIA
ncbi:hypothetical protein [Crocosphaera sp.]|uniref:hypothetical protein n=1 Tax=Crocosphaera sp. TaxID=2729996 RepID=UPI002626C9D2|nr:hypothetical protein [Crocosphaera sp.]MDJ0579652.1 hypothetical protein [Crocosphaera sp.]